MSLLHVKDLGIRFGGLQALENVNFEVGSKSIVGLIGPNGAGKTTLFNLLTGVYQPTTGTINLNGHEIQKSSTHYIVTHGIGRTFQNIRLFKELSVLDNVKVAMHNQMQYTSLEAILKLPRYWAEEKIITKRALELLSVFGLEDKAYETSSNLSYGEQRRLEITRALATNPKILLLDEPAAGMNHTETKDLMETISFVREKFNISILLIEHDMQLVMGVCEQIVVLDYGKVIADGTPNEIRNNKKVIGAYLGTQD